MSTVIRRLIPTLGLGLALILSGCSGGAKGSSLTGPSSPVPSSAVPSGATIQGTVSTGTTSSSSSLAHSQSQSASRAGLRVSVMGTSLFTVTDGSGHFTLTGVPGGKATLHFEGPGIDARLDISGLVEGQVLTINVHVSGSVAQQEQPGQEISFRDTIQAVDSPNLTVGGRLVHTDANTRIKAHGKTIPFSDLKVGQTVEVEGELQSDGSVLAKQVTVEDDNNENEQEVDFKGTIEFLNAPSLTVAGRVVLTDGNTKIKSHGNRLAFSDLKVGQVVEVEARTQSDGSLLAKQITVEDDDNNNENEEEVEFTGTIEAINAPNLTVAGRVVHTDGNTRIKSHGDTIPFSSLTVGQTVEVKGQGQSDGSVLAKQISVEDHD